jgi:NAD(P)-dependent dehydrogenase (short-subunit alcohol dehydrogenase family)
MPFLPDPGIIDYCAAKAALTNFSKALSKELGPRGIRMNTVSPGPVETALWLGPDGVAATVAKNTGVDLETAKQHVIASQGGFAPGGSPVPMKWQTSCCSLPAIVQAISQEQTSSSTEG